MRNVLIVENNTNSLNKINESVVDGEEKICTWWFIYGIR